MLHTLAYARDRLSGRLLPSDVELDAIELLGCALVLGATIGLLLAAIDLAALREMSLVAFLVDGVRS